MSDKRPTFTRKSRPRLDAEERARMIAELAGKTNDSVPEPLELPHVDEEPNEAGANVSADDPTEPADPHEELWEPESVAESDPESAQLSNAAEVDAPIVMLDLPQDYLAAITVAIQAEPDPVPEFDAAMLETAPEPSKSSDPGSDVPVLVGSTQAEPSQSAGPDHDVDDLPHSSPEPSPDPNEIWAQLGSIPVDPTHLERNLIITAGRHDPAHGAFDVLRTRLVQTLYENDWKRVAITSPTRDCGKTFTSVNLAISLSRYETNRTVLMDMDMRNPSVARVLGATNPGSMGDFLQGTASPSSFFKRLGRNELNIGAKLAIGLNDRVEPYAAELFQDPHADAAFERMMRELAPDVVLYDLPPALAFDDVIAFRKHYDGVLMVIGGGTTTAEEIHESMRRIGEDVPLLGVVLNQAEGETRMGYTYGY